MEDKNQDMFKMFEQAMAMSKLFNNTGNGNPEKTDENPTDKFKQAMDMMQMFNMLKQTDQTVNQPEPSKQHETPDPTVEIKHSNVKQSATTEYFDDSIHTPALRSIKSAIPYLEHKYQKNLGIWVKLVELQKLMEMYSNQAVSLQSIKPGRDWRRGMLESIRPFMDEEKKHKIDMLLKCIDMKEIMNMMQSTTT